MKQRFAEALVEAQGRSEFVIVVVADIRGFSKFSTVNESPNIAMFIKRFYLQLINKYFKGANFVKPTGDGLLMTFPYSETDLLESAERVISSCLSCLNDFPSICENDPMINFSVPQSIGFGIARGTACCLYSRAEILDYSGHLLNLASRLNDLARPSGIVIDGGFLKSVIPVAYKELFDERHVYIRSIAEETPVGVYCLKTHVHIPEAALVPLSSEYWKTINKLFTQKQLLSLASRLRVPLEESIKSKDKIKVTIIVPGPKKDVTDKYLVFKHYEYSEMGPDSQIILDIEKLRDAINKLPKNLLRPSAKISIKIDYVPKLTNKT